MQAHNISDALLESRQRRTLALAADTTLTMEQIINNDVLELDTTDNTVAITLLAASAGIASRRLEIFHKKGANASTIVCTAGFGAGHDTVTQAAGGIAIVTVDKAGAYWGVLSNAPPA